MKRDFLRRETKPHFSVYWFKLCFLGVVQIEIPVNAPMIQEFSTKVAKKLSYVEFKGSSGWLTRFKGQHNLLQQKVCGKSADVVIDAVKSWKEHLSSIMSGYEMQGI